jgi:hypothetical protein
VTKARSRWGGAGACPDTPGQSLRALRAAPPRTSAGPRHSPLAPPVR